MRIFSLFKADYEKAWGLGDFGDFVVWSNPEKPLIDYPQSPQSPQVPLLQIVFPKKTFKFLLLILR